VHNTKTEEKIVATLFSFFGLLIYFMEKNVGLLGSHVVNVVYIVIIIIAFIQKGRWIDYLFIFYPFIFHQYYSDPYDANFYGYFNGYYKYIVLFLFVLKYNYLRFNKGLYLIIILILLSITTNLLGPIELFNLIDDLLQFSFLLLFLCRIRSNVIINVPRVLFYYSICLPTIYICQYFLELTNVIYGSIYFFFGHYYGFLIVFMGFYWVYELSSRAKLKYLIPVIINLIVFVQSMQSAHMVMIFVLAGALLVFKRQYIYLLLIPVGWLALNASLDYFPSGSWTYLKLSQLTGFTGGISDMSNSLAIRVVEFINVISNNNTLQHLIGNGFGAYYTDITGLMSLLNLHVSTYPAAELESGRLHLIHEPALKLFFELGIFGMLIFIKYFMKRALWLFKVKFILGIPVVFMFFLGTSNVHSAFTFLICSVMFQAWAKSKITFQRPSLLSSEG